MGRRRKKKNKSVVSKVLKAELILVLVLIVLFVGYKIVSTYKKMDFDNSEDASIQQNEFDDKALGGYHNIAIFGVDSLSNALGKGSRTDTIMVASINNKTKDVKLVSIYRDTYCNIPERGFDKINHAYFFDGYSLALSTINTNFDLNINEYITVNFDALTNAINALGGITLDIEESEIKYINSPNITSAGVQVLNGAEATKYARIRSTEGGDFKRTDRQRKIISAMITQSKSTNPLTLLSIAEEMLPQVSTNIKTTQVLSLTKDLARYNIIDQTGFPFEKDARYYKKVSYVFPVNLEENVRNLHKLLFDADDFIPSNQVKENSAYIESILSQ